MNDKLYRDLRAKIKEMRENRKKHNLPVTNQDIRNEIDNVLACRDAERVAAEVERRDGDRGKIN